MKEAGTLMGPSTVPERGSMSIRLAAGSAGMGLECSPITVKSTGPLVHRGNPGSFMGEALIQRGTGVKQQFWRGEMIKGQESKLLSQSRVKIIHSSLPQVI